MSTNLFNVVLLQAGGAGGNVLVNIIPFVLIFVVMYFFMIRPQMKKAKETKAYIDGLKAGNKVVTIGGVHGTVKSTGEATVVLEIAPNVQIVVEKGAIALGKTVDPTALNA